MNKLLTVAELSVMAQQRGRRVTGGYLRRLCRLGQISGAVKVGKTWALPADQAERWLREWIRAA